VVTSAGSALSSARMWLAFHLPSSVSRAAGTTGVTTGLGSDSCYRCVSQEATGAERVPAVPTHTACRAVVPPCSPLSSLAACTSKARLWPFPVPKDRPCPVTRAPWPASFPLPGLAFQVDSCAQWAEWSGCLSQRRSLMAGEVQCGSPNPNPSPAGTLLFLNYFLWHWDLNSGPTPSVTLLTLFCDIFFFL
jgi:hypothetical protein